MIALLLSTALAAPQPCGLPALLPGRSDVLHEAPKYRGTPAEKVVRDSYGTFATHETANFAIKWGSMSGFDQDDVEALGEAFELSWQIEIEQMGYPPPLQTDAYKFNVYLGDTGGDTPSAMGNSGYYWYDDAGYPMIVVAGDQVGDRNWVSLTAAHEFFHAIQDATAMFEWATRGQWWVESSAVWMEGQVYPNNPDQAYFMVFFAMRPELTLSSYEYPTDGNIEEYHQYGAFVFLEHLEDDVGGDQMLRDVFEFTPGGGDPLETLDTMLNADDSDFDEVFAEFAGRNGTWDYEREDWYEALIDDYGGYGGQSHRPTYTLSRSTEGWMEVPDDAPQTWGANYWRLQGFEGDEVLRFDGELDGEDSPRLWSVQVAAQTGDEHRRIPIDLTDGVGSITGAEVGAYDEAWLVVAPLDQMRGSRTWKYAVAFEAAVDEGDTDTGEEPKACGCAAGPGAGGFAWLLAAWVTRARRGRSGRRPSQES